MGKPTATVRRLIMAIRFVRDLLKPIPIVVLVATVGIAGNLAPAHAERVCVVIIAEVVTVIDLGNYLEGAISEGDVITGTYNYETTTQDTNPLPTVGDYWHTDVPFGITLNAGGFLFRTNPNNVNFLIEIVNDHGTPTSDNYLLRSYSNILDKSVPFETENHISWQLDDPTATAISSTALPTIPPILADWQSFFGLTIRSRNDVFEEFLIRAQVTSANLCNEHTDCEGDFDIDGDVDGSDLAVFAADFGRTDCIE